jgi:hypothetical protein
MFCDSRTDPPISNHDKSRHNETYTMDYQIDRSANCTETHYCIRVSQPLCKVATYYVSGISGFRETFQQFSIDFWNGCTSWGYLPIPCLLSGMSIFLLGRRGGGRHIRLWFNLNKYSTFCVLLRSELCTALGSTVSLLIQKYVVRRSYLKRETSYKVWRWQHWLYWLLSLLSRLDSH